MPSTVLRENVWANVSPPFKCWRLVYNPATNHTLILFERDGRSVTIQSMFCSTRTDKAPGAVTSAQGKQECLDEIKSLGLQYTEPNNKLTWLERLQGMRK